MRRPDAADTQQCCLRKVRTQQPRKQRAGDDVLTRRRVLIFIHSFEPFADSNTNALLPLLPFLTQDYDVDILCANKNNKMKWRDRSHGCTVFRYANVGKFFSVVFRYARAEVSNVWGAPPRTKLRSTLRNARIGAAKLTAQIYPHWDYSTLKWLLKSRHYAAVVTVTSPMAPQFVVLRAKREGLLERSRTAWIPWFMDPHATYIGHSASRNALITKERAVYDAAQVVIVTPELHQDNATNEFAEYGYKTRRLPLANLRVTEEPDMSRRHESNSVNLLYAGSLQDVAVRNPTPLFRLIANSPPNFIYHMMITTWCREAEELRDQYLLDCNRVSWHTPLPLEESLAFNEKMDVLINIGNEVANQLPGKCYDLVGTGKPILNIFTRDDDTSEKFFQRYPLHLGLKSRNPSAGVSSMEQQIAELSSFVDASQGRRVPAATIKDLYQEFLPESVYQTFKAILSEAAEP